MQFPFHLLADNTCIYIGPFMFPVWKGLFVFVFSIQGFQFFVETLPFGFSFPNFKRDAYVAVDHSLKCFYYLSA